MFRHSLPSCRRHHEVANSAVLRKTLHYNIRSGQRLSRPSLINIRIGTTNEKINKKENVCFCVDVHVLVCCSGRIHLWKAFSYLLVSGSVCVAIVGFVCLTPYGGTVTFRYLMMSVKTWKTTA